MNGNGGGGMIGIIILIIFLILAGVGGYFGYTKWWVPKQCVGQDPDKTSNVSTFMYDSKKGVCVANVCIDGYGDKATGGRPVKGVCLLTPSDKRVYKPVTANPTTGTTTGLCVGSTLIKETNSGTDDSSCGKACDSSTTACVGYDWNTGTVTSPDVACNLYSGTTPTTGDGTASITCNALQNNPTSKK